ncbi:MAG TPA: bacteriohopanetetrol glucosamine biosynthesis glycosyltransferase HpnI [Xanthobacteraceae bacterium]|nr:bacteriohopanetetrol glucosamine biosynthesis glycosyltransferase HpnI [Xanthobacteraceae bacterium]
MCAGFGCLYLLAASLLVFRFTRRGRGALRQAPAVSILKPLHGFEPRLFGRLSSFCLQDYPGPVQLVFGTSDSTDPAIDVLRRLQSAFPEKSIGWHAGSQEHGTNRKISNLINIARLARHDVLIVADSDIEVGRNYLCEVIGELQEPGVGAVTCIYHGVPGAGIWSRLSALAVNSEFLPQVAFALSFRLATPCFGATIAIRRGVLAAIGGFSSFSECLADDYAIGEAVRASGYKVAIPPLSVGHVCFEDSLRALLARQLRFVRTIKSIDPIGYAGSVVTHPFPIALIGALTGDTRCLMIAVAALMCRATACAAVERALALPGQDYWLIPIQDLLSFAVYLLGYFGATVDWRGHRYRLLANGTLVPIEK